MEMIMSEFTKPRRVAAFVYYGAVMLILSMFLWNTTVHAQEKSFQKLFQELKTSNKLPTSKGSSRATSKAKDQPDRYPKNVSVKEKFIFDLTPAERKIVQQYCLGEIAENDNLLLLVEAKFSRLEMDYCRRSGVFIPQFGYNLFGSRPVEEFLGGGAIESRYVLGEGDQILFSFYGRETGSETVTVDRQGRLLIRDLPPLAVAGMTFGSFRRLLEAKIKTRKVGTEVFVSLAEVKSVAVTVAGEVNSPGRYRMTALSSVLEAIATAQGVKKTGSLRRIKILRGDQITWIDLYDLLLSTGFAQDLALRDGDRIVVPLIGDTLAVTGFVNRSGVFELAEGQQTLSIKNALKLGGGGIRSKGVYFQHFHFDEAGQEKVTEVSVSEGMVQGGDIVSLVQSKNIQLETVELSGHVRVPGRRSLRAAATVKDLLGSENNLKSNPYLLFAALETTDPVTRARQYFPINLRRVLDNEENFALRDGDRLIVLGAEDIEFLTSHDVRAVLGSQNSLGNISHLTEGENKSEETKNPLAAAARGFTDSEDTRQSKSSRVSQNFGMTRRIVQNLIDRKLISMSDEQIQLLESQISKDEDNSCTGLIHLSALIGIAGNQRFKNAMHVFSQKIEGIVENVKRCPRIFNKNPSFLPFVLEHSISLIGEIRKPGIYPVTSKTVLSNIISVAGGLTGDASLEQLEVSNFGASKNVRDNFDLTKTSANSITLEPGALVRVKAVYKDLDSGPVHLSGQFLRPGYYDIRRGERLSEVIARAGGLTVQAYPYGTVFTRESAKATQKEAMRRTARELQSSLLYAGGNKATSPQSLVLIQDLTRRIEQTEPLGRVVIEADPTVLQVRPEFDVVLESGDRVFVPKRPSSVLVIGDVLNPGGLQFISGSAVDHYVNQAGGFQQSADEDRMFLVYPNGVAEPITASVWNYNPVQVPPGSTIVVPKDVTPLDLFTLAKDITTLLSQMAITAASLAVIGNN
jgi:polysaccharide biosynthesis/export protein